MSTNIYSKSTDPKVIASIKAGQKLKQAIDDSRKIKAEEKRIRDIVRKLKPGQTYQEGSVTFTGGSQTVRDTTFTRSKSGGSASGTQSTSIYGTNVAVPTTQERYLTPRVSKQADVYGPVATSQQISSGQIRSQTQIQAQQPRQGTQVPKSTSTPAYNVGWRPKVESFKPSSTFVPGSYSGREADLQTVRQLQGVQLTRRNIDTFAPIIESFEDRPRARQGTSMELIPGSLEFETKPLRAKSQAFRDEQAQKILVVGGSAVAIATGVGTLLPLVPVAVKTVVGGIFIAKTLKSVGSQSGEILGLAKKGKYRGAGYNLLELGAGISGAIIGYKASRPAVGLAIKKGVKSFTYKNILPKLDGIGQLTSGKPMFQGSKVGKVGGMSAKQRSGRITKGELKKGADFRNFAKSQQIEKMQILKTVNRLGDPNIKNIKYTKQNVLEIKGGKQSDLIGTIQQLKQGFTAKEIYPQVTTTKQIIVGAKGQPNLYKISAKGLDRLPKPQTKVKLPPEKFYFEGKADKTGTAIFGRTLKKLDPTPRFNPRTISPGSIKPVNFRNQVEVGRTYTILSPLKQLKTIVRVSNIKQANIPPVKTTFKEYNPFEFIPLKKINYPQTQNVVVGGTLPKQIILNTPKGFRPGMKQRILQDIYGSQQYVQRTQISSAKSISDQLPSQILNIPFKTGVRKVSLPKVNQNVATAFKVGTRKAPAKRFFLTSGLIFKKDTIFSNIQDTSQGLGQRTFLDKISISAIQQDTLKINKQAQDRKQITDYTFKYDFDTPPPPPRRPRPPRPPPPITINNWNEIPPPPKPPPPPRRPPPPKPPPPPWIPPPPPPPPPPGFLRLKMPKFNSFAGLGSFAGFGVKVKRRGKFEVLGTGLTQAEAIRFGQIKTNTSTARTFKIFRTGSVKRKQGGVVDLLRYRRSKKDPFAFVEKTKFAISTREEKEELSRARRRNKNLFRF